MVDRTPALRRLDGGGYKKFWYFRYRQTTNVDRSATAYIIRVTIKILYRRSREDDTYWLWCPPDLSWGYEVDIYGLSLTSIKRIAMELDADVCDGYIRITTSNCNDHLKKQQQCSECVCHIFTFTSITFLTIYLQIFLGEIGYYFLWNTLHQYSWKLIIWLTWCNFLTVLATKRGGGGNQGRQGSVKG